MIDSVLDEWYYIKPEFLVHMNANCFALHLLPKAHDEEYITKTLYQREKVLLLSVLGYQKEKRRERRLGYILIFLGKPIIKPYTWYVVAAYTPKDETKHRDWSVVFDDGDVRLVRVGIGTFDYMFSRLPRNADLRRMLDMEGYSDSAVHLETEDLWKIGL